MSVGKSAQFITTFGGVRTPDVWESRSASSLNGAAFESVIEGAYQTREEIEWLECLLNEVKPRHILEIGVARGGVSRLFCDAVGPAGHVVGLDISDELVADDVRQRANYTLLVGNSHERATFDRVCDLHKHYDLLLIDGDHSAAGVRQDTEWYLPLVRDGGTILWHDVRVEPDAGIKPYWYGELRRQLPGAAEFYVDAYNNGLGFWRKMPQRMADILRDAEDFCRTGRPDDALKLLAVVADGDPYFPGLWPLWSEAALAAGSLDAAAMALARAVVLTPEDKSLNARIATIRASGVSTALLDTTVASMAAAGSADLALRRADLAKGLGLLDCAIEETRMALELDPIDLSARRSLLELLTASNRTQREMIDVVVSGIRAHGQDDVGRKAAFDYFVDWIERLQNRSFIMQRFAEMAEFAILLRQESVVFVKPCLNVFKRHLAHPWFYRLRAVLEDKIALLPEAESVLRTS